MKAKTREMIDEWQAEFEKHKPRFDPTAKTLAEIAAGLGRGRNYVARFVAAQVKAGRYERVAKLVERDGYLYPTPAYRIVKG
jgi:hypothetical protein